MEHIKRSRRRKVRKSGSDWSSLKEVPTADFPKLQLYVTPPTEEISLEDFEEIAIKRVQLLKAMEEADVRHGKNPPEYRMHVNKALRKYLPADDGNRQDHLGHHILRLAYCKSEDLRRWFLKYESDLFKFRFKNATKAERQLFIKKNNLHYNVLSEDEKRALAPQLTLSHRYIDGSRQADAVILSGDFYKVPFTEALELIRSRRVVLMRGWAYVPSWELLSIMHGVFRMQLSATLTAISKALPQLEEDDRVLPMLSSLSKQYVSRDFVSSKNVALGQVTPGDVPALARESFPLCMSNLHAGLDANHHLRHQGRMQYGLFLKGIGLSLDDALQFWKQQFTQAMTVDNFDKKYAYNIRHNYGKEGKRTDYTPYSCQKIIMGTGPGNGEHHGCPFRHHDEDSLWRKLNAKEGVTSAEKKEIVGLVKDRHYQLACVRYFEVTHKNAQKQSQRAEFSLNHPNQYFEESRKIILGLKGDNGSRRSSGVGAAASPGAATRGPAAPKPASDLAELAELMDEDADWSD